MRTSLAASCCFVSLALTAGCSSSSNPAPTVSISPGSATVTGPTVFTARVEHSNAQVAWTLTGPGSLSAISGPRVTYRPPAAPGAGQTATLQAAVAGASASVTLTLGPALLDPVSVAGLGHAVTVTYDEREIPHVTCAEALDCFRVQGWLHARDRLFQMDFLRRVATGKLAELVGPLGLSQDVQLRTLFTTRAGERLGAALARAMDPGAKATVDAYIAGINTYLAGLRASGAPLPGEYAQLPYPVSAADIPDWTEADVLSFSRLQQYSLSGSLSEESALGRFAAVYGPGGAAPSPGKMDVYVRCAQPSSEGTHTLTGGLPAALPSIALAPPAALGAWTGAIEATHEKSAAVDALLKPFEGSAGSNNWVVDAGHSQSGHAMVANDPHLSLQYPPNFYLSTLTSTNPADHLNVTGGSFPGVPGALVGRGEKVGWGVTVVGYDVTDLYLEQAVPSSVCDGLTGKPANTAFCVLFNGAPAAVLAFPQTFMVRTATGLANAVTLQLLAAQASAVYLVPHHGPIIQSPDAGGHAVSVRWTGQEDWTNDLHAFLGLAVAQDVDEAMAAIDSFATGAQNFVLADEAGSIAYYPHALVPNRAFADAVTPTAKYPPWFPVPGTGAAEWGTGVAADNCAGTAAAGTKPAAACWIDKTQLPQGKNPAKGYFITANADPLGVSDGNPPLPVDSHGHYLSYFWDDSTAFRHARITERLTALAAGTGKVTLADMESIQSDHVSRAGAAFERILANQAMFPSAGMPADFNLARGLLAQWAADGFDCPTGLVGSDPAASPASTDPVIVTDSAACYLFHSFLRTLLANVFTDDLQVAGLGVDGGAAIKGMLHMLENPTTADQSFCGASAGACQTQVVTALVTSFDLLAARYGDPAAGGWAWGRVHTMQPVSQFPMVTVGYEPGPYARPGGAFTVDVGNPSLGGSSLTFSFGSSGNVRHISVMDPAAPHVRMQLPGPERSLPTGTIAGPDMLGEWVTNTYFDFAHGPAQGAAAAVATQTFSP